MCTEISLGSLLVSCKRSLKSDFSAVSIKTGQSKIADSAHRHTFVSVIAEVNTGADLARILGDKLTDSGGLVRGEGWGPAVKVSGVYPSSPEKNAFLLDTGVF